MKKLDTNTIIKRFKKNHNNKYDYSKVQYKGAKEKVEIVCPEHGSFFILPHNHTKGDGCKYCNRDVFNLEDFIEKGNKTHNNKYDYSKSKYNGVDSKTIISCPIHGEFLQKISSHLDGNGCPECGKLITNRLSNKEFKEKSYKIHNNFYDYSMVDYKNYLTPVKIICPVHGIFEQKPRDHLQGCNCPLCSKNQTAYTKYKNKKTWLYYVYILKYNVYKIGLSKNSVKNRFKYEDFEVEILDEVLFEDGYQAYLLEQGVIEENKEHLWQPLNEEKIGGWTECFVKDIL